ncbi:MAG: ribose 5-phosphate isomerase B [Nanoarchaeota archaeon]
MKIVIGSDHAGYKLKEKVKDFVKGMGYDVDDVGTYSEESVDYPVYAKKVGKEVSKDKSKVGILICGTGLGMCMAANKIKGIRAALAYNESSAQKAKQHNDANVLCLGAREFDESTVENITKKFLETPFDNEERHERRIKEIEKIK